MKCDALETCFTAADMLYSSADMLYYLHADAAFTRTDSLETWAINNPSSGSKPFKVVLRPHTLVA
jgi:hypothetical protein